MSGAPLATARLVRPAYRPPVRAPILSEADLLREDLGTALDEVDQLKARLTRQNEMIVQLKAGVDADAAARVAQLERVIVEHEQTISTMRRRWKPTAKRRRVTAKFPLALEQRTGLAAVLQHPLVLRSGAWLDPFRVAVRHGDQVAVFPDSSWLVLARLAQQPGAWIDRRDLEAAVFGRASGDSVRSAIHRARRTLESVGAEGDLESTLIARRGNWRLMIVESKP